jgi:RNA polymerase sigma-70 factor (ECF subfamily)
LVAEVSNDDSSSNDGRNYSDPASDRPTVESLHAQFGTDLIRFVTALAKDSEIGQEVVQTVFHRAIERYDSIKTSFRGWLFQVAFNEVALIKRKQSREKEVLSDAVWTLSALRAANVDDAQQRLEDAERARFVREAIGKLSEDQQLVVRMKIYEDKTFAVIAEELGIPLGTALTRMRSAIHKLRTLLSDE